ADPRVPELGRGGAGPAEADRARELGATGERGGAGVGAPAPLRFGAVRRTSLGRASRTAPHRRYAGAPTPALRAATVLTPPPEGTGYAALPAGAGDTRHERVGGGPRTRGDPEDSSCGRTGGGDATRPRLRARSLGRALTRRGARGNLLPSGGVIYMMW